PQLRTVLRPDPRPARRRATGRAARDRQRHARVARAGEPDRGDLVLPARVVEHPGAVRDRPGRRTRHPAEPGAVGGVHPGARALSATGMGKSAAMHAPSTTGTTPHAAPLAPREWLWPPLLKASAACHLGAAGR